jgi:hypothetical protein
LTFPGPLVSLCVLLVAGLWFMNTTWSDAVWDLLAPLAVLQFPWRLYGPSSLALAVAGTAGFAWCAARARQQWALALLLAAFVVVNGRGAAGAATRARPPESLPPLGALLRAQEDATLGSGTLSGGEFLPRSVITPGAPPLGWSWRDAFEARYPSGGWIAGRVWPLDATIDVIQVADAPLITTARVAVDGDAPTDLAFRTLVFPGWRAYLDGQPVPLRAAPYDPLVDLAPGFAVVSVPPGTHAVQLALGATPPRTLGTLITLAGIAAAAALALPLSRRRRALPLLAGGTLLIALLILVADLSALRGPPLLAGAPPDTIVLDPTTPRDAAPQAPAPTTETIAGHTRRALHAPTPTSLSFDLDVPPNAAFQTGLGVATATLDDPDLPGVRFVLVVTAAGTRDTLLDQTLLPATHPLDRGWRFAEVPLDAYAGQRVTLTLRTESVDSPAPVPAAWATPLVYVDRSGRAGRPPEVAPALDFVPWRQPEPSARGPG